jgi:hypothetical protein
MSPSYEGAYIDPMWSFNYWREYVGYEILITDRRESMSLRPCSIEQKLQTYILICPLEIDEDINSSSEPIRYLNFKFGPMRG